MDRSESIKELAAALAKAQGSMSAAKMDSTNPFLKNKYADLGSVIQAAKGPLAANGIAYSQHPSIDQNSVTVTTMIFHASGEWMTSELSLPLDGSKGLSLAQSMGAVITYMRRYSLASILGIYADEDTDGNQAKPKLALTSISTAKTPEPAPAPAATPAQAPEPEKPWTSTVVTLETAMGTTSAKDGKYWLMETAPLTYRFNEIEKMLKANGLEPKAHDDAEFKRDVVKSILDYRAQDAPQ